MATLPGDTTARRNFDRRRAPPNGEYGHLPVVRPSGPVDHPGLALRERRDPSLLVLVDYLNAAVKWHGRLELEAVVLSIAGSELALAALGVLRVGDKEAVGILRRLLGRRWFKKLRKYRRLRRWRGELLQPTFRSPGLG